MERRLLLPPKHYQFQSENDQFIYELLYHWYTKYEQLTDATEKILDTISTRMKRK